MGKTASNGQSSTAKEQKGRRDIGGVEGRGKVVPPERVELSSPAPEAGTLSTELQGHCTSKNSMVE